MTADAVVPLASSHLRIARPARDLERAEKFWVQGLGMTVLYRAAPSGPTGEDLLVLYLGVPAGDALIERLVGAGGKVVPARNPYWDRWGVTIADPDGYRLVLSHRGWE